MSVDWLLVTVILVGVSATVLVYDLVLLSAELRGKSRRRGSGITSLGRRCLERVRALRLEASGSVVAQNEEILAQFRQRLREIPVLDSSHAAAHFERHALLALKEVLTCELVCSVAVAARPTDRPFATADLGSFESSERLPDFIVERISVDTRSAAITSAPSTEFSVEELPRHLHISNRTLFARSVLFFRTGEGSNVYMWVGYSRGQAASIPSRDIVTRAVAAVRAEFEIRELFFKSQSRLRAVHDEVKQSKLTIAHIAHDMRSPLASLNTVLTMLQDKEHENERVELMEVGRQSCSFAARLSEELILAGRSEAPVSDVLHETAVMEVLECTIRSHQNRTSAMINFSTDGGISASTCVRMRATDLMRVFDNVLGNSIKFGSNREVFVLLTGDSKFVTVSFRDQGFGYSGEPSKVFDPFVRGDSSVPGFGLGLSSVADLVRGCGGNVEFSSRVGEGSIVTVRLPRMEDTVGSAARFVEAEPTSKSVQLVILDDNRELGESLQRVLTTRGIVSRCFTDHRRALRCIEEHEEVRVLTDLQMPELSAQDFVAAIRSFRPSTRIAVMSGDLSDQITYSLGALGVEQVFAKPIELTTLQAWIENHEQLTAKAA